MRINLLINIEYKTTITNIIEEPISIISGEKGSKVLLILNKNLIKVLII